MLRPCQNAECGTSYADDMRACPVCGTLNDLADEQPPAKAGLSFRLKCGRSILLSFLAVFLLIEFAIIASNILQYGLQGLLTNTTRVFLTVLLGCWLYHGSRFARSIAIVLCLISGVSMLYLIHFSQLNRAAPGTILQIVPYFYLLFVAVLIVPSAVTEFLSYQWAGKR